jgi:hypothetical protein
MGIFYRGSDGIEQVVAGLAPAGQLIPSVSLYQKGRVTATNITAGGYVTKDISFANTMPNTDYIVVINNASNGYMSVDVVNKTTSGFTAFVYNRATSVIDTGAFDWQAFKLLTNEDRALDEAKIEQNTANFANNFSATTSYAIGDYCIYQGILYRCTTAHTAGTWVAGHFTQATVGKTLSDIVPSNASSSNKLVDKATLNKINITHQSAGEAQQYANTWTELATMPIGANTYARNSIAIRLICCYGGNTKN